MHPSSRTVFSAIKEQVFSLFKAFALVKTLNVIQRFFIYFEYFSQKFQRKT